MKALTVWQPWATLIAIGAKPYEFRKWVPPKSMVGKRIAIHAGARAMRGGEIRALLNQCRYPEHYGQPCIDVGRALPILRACRDGTAALPMSHVVCTAILGEPQRGDLCAAEFGAAAGGDSEREGTFNWGWPMLEVEELKPPLPARGAQGFWDWRP